MFQGNSRLPATQRRYTVVVLNNGSTSTTEDAGSPFPVFLSLKYGSYSSTSGKRPRPTNRRSKRPPRPGSNPFPLASLPRDIRKAIYEEEVKELGALPFRVGASRLRNQSVQILPLHAYSYEQSQLSVSVVRLNRTIGAGGVTSNYSEGFDISASSPANGWDFVWPNVDSLVYNRAVDKLYDKLRGSVDLAVDIAEAHQVQKMFSATAQLEGLAKGLASRFRLFKIPGQLWLQYQYGWRPLLNDIYDSALETTEIVLNALESVRVRATQNLSDLPLRYTSASESNSTVEIRTVGEGKWSYTIGMRYRTQSFDIAKFTSLNPVSLAWELVPYSFVVDWFYSIGGYLRNLESAVFYDSRFVEGYLSKLQVYEGRPVGSYVSGNNPKLTRVYDGNARKVVFSRTLLTQPPRPRAPVLQANLGSSRLFSAAALLSNLLKR